MMQICILISQTSSVFSNVIRQSFDAYQW